MKRLPVILLIAIPAASVIMGLITAYLAFSGPDQEIRAEQAPLDKSSWRKAEDRNDR